MMTSQPCFFLIVLLFYSANQYQDSAALGGVEPRIDPGIRSFAIQIGSSRVKRETRTLQTVKTSQYDVSKFKLDRTKLGRNNSLQRPRTRMIPNCLFRNMNQDKTYPSQLAYKFGSGQNSRFDPKKIRRRHSVLTSRKRRFGQGIYASTFSIPSPTNDTPKKGVRIEGTENGISASNGNLTVTVPKLDLCVHVCLAHALCAGAAFDVRKLTCRLMGSMDDMKHKKVRHVGVEMHRSGSNGLKIFTVNPTVLTHIIGKCADQPCTNGTFCSQAIEKSYICLPLDKFLLRIQKRNVQREDDNEARGTELVKRKKRSLNESKKRNQSQPPTKGKSKHKQQVDCGLPPKLPKALSLYVNTLVGDLATYFCEEGSHTRATNTNLRCQKNGKWTKPTFYCISHKHCDRPRELPGALMKFFMVNGRDMIAYKCKNNPIINAVSMCNPRNGTWSPVQLKCNTRPQGKKDSPEKNLRVKNRDIPKTKKPSHNITHTKEKSMRTLGRYAVIGGRKSQTLNNQIPPRKHLKTPGVPESENGRKAKTSDSASVFKNSLRLDSSKESANRSRLNVPKKRYNVSETKSRPKKIKESRPSSFTRDIKDDSKELDRNPMKSDPKNRKQASVFTAHKNADRPSIIDPKMRLNLSGAKPIPNEMKVKNLPSFTKNTKNKPHSSEDLNTSNPMKSDKKNSEQLSPFTVHKNVLRPSKIGPKQKKASEFSHGVTTNITKNDPASRKKIKKPKTPIQKPPRKNNNTSENPSITTSRPSRIKAAIDNPKFILNNSVGFNSSKNVHLINTTRNQGSFNSSGKHRVVRINNKTENNQDPKTNSTGRTKSTSDFVKSQATRTNQTSMQFERKTSNDKSGTKSEKNNETSPQINSENESPSDNSLMNLFEEDYKLFLESKFADELIDTGVDGVVRADVNARLGVPGFKCEEPAVLQYASSFYGSRVIGAKASFRCNRYFFAEPVPYCPMVTCLIQGMWSELFLSCSDLDCINPAKMYVGKRMCTNSGYKCKRWDEVITDPETLSTLYFPERNISLANNFCRDPLRDGIPWCFTNDPTMIWDYCDIPFCE